MQILWTDKGTERYQLFSGRKPGTFYHRIFRKRKNHSPALSELLERPDKGIIRVKRQTVFDAANPTTMQDAEIRKNRLHFGLVSVL